MPVSLPGVEVDAGEQGVVVEHLLEVGHQPDGVGGVAVEAAADLVVDAAAAPSRRSVCSHRLERCAALPVRVVAAQEEVERHRLRELGRAAEAAELGVVGRAASPSQALVEQRLGVSSVSPACRRDGAPMCRQRAAGRRARCRRACRGRRRRRRWSTRGKPGMPWRSSGGK